MVLVFLLVLGVFTSSAYALGMSPQQPMRVGGTGAVSVPPPTEQAVEATAHWEASFGEFYYLITWEPAESALYHLQVVLQDDEGNVVGEGTTIANAPAAPRSDYIFIFPIPSIADIASVEVRIVQD